MSRTEFPRHPEFSHGLERFELDVLHIAIKDALRMGAISFDAIKHLVLCRVERRPPRAGFGCLPVPAQHHCRHYVGRVLHEPA